jgi:protein-S-isoprenylcysteine O-methyltransferase Ste14
MVTLAWSWIILAEAKAASKLAVRGPYALIRHPIFATILWDGTGCLAFYFKAWVVLLALVPLSLLWSYLASIEELYLEREYGSEYWHHFAHKGQLFPSFKGPDRMPEDGFDN